MDRLAEERTEIRTTSGQAVTALTLRDYEARIHLYKEQIGTGYIGIGRTLLEAKEARVVPHGEWEKWVTETTGLTARQAQRCMQAATEIGEGSALARLEMSKALLLLGSGLDADAREAIAERTADEGATVRALKEEIRQAKMRLVAETGAATEMKMQLDRARQERDGLEAQMRAQAEAYQARMNEEREGGYLRGMQDGKADAMAATREKLDRAQRERAELAEQMTAQAEAYRAQIDRETAMAYQQGVDSVAEATAREMADQEAEIRRLKADLLQAENNRVEVAPADYEQIKRNQADLLAAAEDAERRAADAEAELEALRAGQDPDRMPAAAVLARAVNAFMRECELMPWYPAELQADAGPIRNSLKQLNEWAARMQEALEATVEAEGAVE